MYCQWQAFSDDVGHECYARIFGGPGACTAVGRRAGRYVTRTVVPMDEVVTMGRAITAYIEAAAEQLAARPLPPPPLPPKNTPPPD